jgi:transcriptional regulator with XRE-family HTH domain
MIPHLTTLSGTECAADTIENSNDNLVLEETFATRLKLIIGSESISAFARRCGIGESLLRKYLNGSLPNSHNLVLIADAAGVTVDWLASGRLPRSRAEITAQSSEIREDEFLLLMVYRESNKNQKIAIRKLIDAIRNPGGLAWYRVGEAIAKIANFFPAKPL